jgi:hypothetical protein
VFYDATRKLVLRGADAVVFVADSQGPALDSNKESFQNLIDNLAEQGVDLAKIPHVIQWNKRDTPNALPVEELEKEINRFGAPTYEACATQGMGVHETLEGISRLALQHLSDKFGGSPFEPEEGKSPEPQAQPDQKDDFKWSGGEMPSIGNLSPDLEDFSHAQSLEDVESIGERVVNSSNAIEIPIVLERSRFKGTGPFEIKFKLFLK